jgi:hypothetical protein
MGLAAQFSAKPHTVKKYDFVYVGEVSKKRSIDRFLKAFEAYPQHTLCLVGQTDKAIFERYKNFSNITFKGKVPYKDVANILPKATYGLNLIPIKYPYTVQTSTKLLEYLAMGLKVITTDYPWVKTFERTHQASFFRIDLAQPNLDLEKLKEFNFYHQFLNHLSRKVISKFYYVSSQGYLVIHFLLVLLQ